MKKFWKNDKERSQKHPIKQMFDDLLEREQHDLREARRMMGKASSIIGDFSLSKKGSWPGFAERVLGAVIDGSGLYQDVNAYMDANGRVLAAEDVPIALHNFGINREKNMVFERGNIRAMAHKTADDIPFWIVHFGGDTEEWDLFVLEGQEPAVVYDHLSGLLWKDHRAMRVDLKRSNESYGPGEVTLEPLPLDDRYTYVGELTQCIESWKKFHARGIRRNVLLQGKPGCGKSTLCLHAARQLSQRCALVTSHVYSSYDGNDWDVLMRLLTPQMLILDDIDRVGSDMLGKKLALFEENKTYEVPLVMFTSNDIEEIPQAFRRPGRIDQILVVEEPQDSVRREMITQLAKEVGIDTIPAEQWPILLQMLQDLSGAHVVEALRRAYALGWDAPKMKADITFNVTKKEDD